MDDAADPGPCPATPTEVSLRECFKVIAMVSAVVVGLCAGCVAMFASIGSDSDPGPYVTVACRDWARGRLKSPSTANFSQETAQGLGDGRWRVTGVVDSQNSFGAVVRSAWTCEATYAGEETTLVSVSVDG
jgi:hypothetical protein